MALAFDAVSFTSGSGSSSVTLSHTCSGSDRILIVNAGVHGNARTVTDITYNGVAMTYSTEQVNGSALAKVYQYYLIAPATGTHDIVVTYSGNADYSVGGISLTGADQTSPKGAVGGGTGTGSAPSNAVVTTFANSMVLSGVVWAGQNAGSCSATGTNQTTRYAIDNGSVFLEAGGSTQTTTTAGSTTSSWTGGASAGYAHSLTEIKEVQPAT